MFTDMRQLQWIENLPERYRPYVYLARLDRPIGIWLLLLPCFWSMALAYGAAGVFSFRAIWLAILFTLGAIVMRSAGCVINDLWDRKIDALIERTAVRPIASGEISIAGAIVFLSALLFGGFCILIMMNGTVILQGLLVIPLIVAYPLAKRFTNWPQLILGMTFNFGALMGWSAVMDDIALAPFLLYSAAILWTLGYDTIYAHQDKEDDALVGVKSTALIFGRASKMWVGAFYFGMILCLSLAFALAGVNLLALPGLVIIGAHLAWQLYQWDIDDPESALETFKSNRDLGLIILAVVILSALHFKVF